jgi:hypothetical protein|tara:strand:- start:186 stop:734 length:549 start_codon:yes stop_codon:yes gene_type:complete
MAIKITVGSKQPPEPPKPDPIAEVELQIRRTANGDYFISDHADIDIIVMKDKNKILAIAKDIMSEMVYGAEDRLFSFLIKKGLVSPESVQGGSVYGSMEGNLLPSDELNVINMVILNISKYIDEERPYFEFVEKFDEMETDYFTEPEEEDSTELGEVPQEVEKGTIRPGYTYGPYWQSYTYE